MTATPTASVIPFLAGVTARCSFLYPSVEPAALYLTFVTGIRACPPPPYLSTPKF
jgi:hypothetical protein